MRIFDEVRGHFALLVNQEFITLSTGTRFKIKRVKSTKPRQTNWAVVIRPTQGKNDIPIYVTDMLLVYAWICSTHREMTLQEVDDVVRDSHVNFVQAPYLMALIATFDDVKVSDKKPKTIKHVSHEDRDWDKYGTAIKK